MTRDESIIEILRIITLSPTYYRVAVILPSFAEVETFSNDVESHLNSIVVWLRPDVIRKTHHLLMFDNARIDITNSISRLQGQTYTHMYKSVFLDKNQQTEIGQIELIHKFRNNTFKVNEFI